MISVKKLRRLLNYLNMPYIDLNDEIEYTKKGSLISINNIKFPINLNCEQGAFLLGCIVSDGCIYKDKKSRGVLRTKYSTNEKESIVSFVNSISKIYGKVHMNKEIVRTCTILRIGSSIVGGCLIKAGAILGHKARNDGELPWLIRYKRKLQKHYLRASFSDEASVYFGKPSYIVISRYKHIADLNKEQLNSLNEIEKEMVSRKFPTGHINKSITVKRLLKNINDPSLRKKIKSIPNLLKGESGLLKNFNIEHRIWNRSLNKTSLGNYSLCCDLFINKKESLKKFYKEIGFDLSSKQEKLIKIIKNMR
jgi:hypothetical protein